MAKVMPVVQDDETTGYMVFCPACQAGHLFNTKANNPNGLGGTKPVWTFNGDVAKPTFRRSMLVKTGHHAGGHKDGDDCWCTYEARYGKPPPAECSVCHSFVTDGQIAFLADSTHALAGQTVDLPDWTEINGGK